METTVNGWNYISAIFRLLLEESQKKENLIEPQFIFRGITRRYFTTSNKIKEDLITILQDKLFQDRIKRSLPLEKQIEQVYKNYYSELIDYFKQNIKHKKPYNLLDNSMKCHYLKYVVPEFINSGAVVRMQQESKQISDIDFINYNKHMLNDLKNRFPKYLDESYTDIEILADVQHKGAASCLIDFSTNFLTALWFATKSDPKEIGFLFCFDINKEMMENDRLYVLGTNNITRPIEDLLRETTKKTKYRGNKQYKFWLWKPSNLNERIVMQNSVFVFSLEPFVIADHEIITIPIPPEWKRPIQHVLKSFFGTTAESIFYDIDGYAESNSKLSPYKKTYLHYFSEQYDQGDSIITLDEIQNGMECFFQSEYELALKYFTLFESKIGLQYNPKYVENTLSQANTNFFTHLKLFVLTIDVHYTKGLCLKHIGVGNEFGAIKEFLIARDVCDRVLAILYKYDNCKDDDIRFERYINYIEGKKKKTFNDLMDLYYLTKQFEEIQTLLKSLLVETYTSIENDKKNRNKVTSENEGKNVEENDEKMSLYYTMLKEIDTIASIDKYKNLIRQLNTIPNKTNLKKNKEEKDEFKKIENYSKLVIKKTQPLYYVLICYYECIDKILNGMDCDTKLLDSAITNGEQKDIEYKSNKCFTVWDLSNLTHAINELRLVDHRLYSQIMNITTSVANFINYVQGKIENEPR